MTPDFINGLFEFAGAAFLSLNVRQILHDKVVKGVHWSSTVFFTSWGFWNLYYYPSLEQWWSFAGGVAIVAVNSVWLYLIWYYSTIYRSRKRASDTVS